MGTYVIPNILTWTVFLSGVTMATFGASGIFFLKLWKETRDRFFLGFAMACWLLSLERIAGLLVASALDLPTSVSPEVSSYIYIFRLLAFLTILYVVIDKNRRVT